MSVNPGVAKVEGDTDSSSYAGRSGIESIPPSPDKGCICYVLKTDSAHHKDRSFNLLSFPPNLYLQILPILSTLYVHFSLL